MIEQFSVLNEYKEIIRINKILIDKEVSIADGKKIKFKNIFNNHLSFRQTNSFMFDSTKKYVSFIINALTTKELNKGYEITVDVNLLLADEEMKKEAKCKVNKNISFLKSELQLPVDLICEINNIVLNKDVECIGLEIEESQSILNIPKDKKLCNPKKVDKLISNKKIEKAKENQDIPVFNSTSIDTSSSISKGLFIIKGNPLNNIKKEFNFNITLVSGQLASCNISKSTKGNETKIICELDGTIEKSKIMIPLTTVFEEYKEMFILYKKSTNKEVSCSNGKLKKIIKRLDKKISFRQMNNYILSGTELSFIFSAFVSENMKKGKQIDMNMNLNLGKDTFIAKIANCVLKEEISGASQEKQLPADFSCSIKDLENANKIEGLVLISCEEISGIPKDPNMTNPIEIDKLIKTGKIKDYSLKENKNIIPPIFKEYSLDSLGCKLTGIFKLKGKFDKPINHFRFNLPLSYPVVDIRCDVPNSNGGEEVEVTCKTKSKFSSSKIIIEQSTISYNGSEAISLLPISSNNEVSCQDFSSVYLKKYLL